MKRVILLLVVALLPIVANAQYYGGARYKEIRKDYNPKEYVKSDIDPFSPGWSGFYSFFIPGSAQILSGEVWRGIAFVAGNALCAGMLEQAFRDMTNYIDIDFDANTVSWLDKDKGQACMWLIGAFTAADLGLAIWSSIDASRIAKVKNMYYQDKYGRRSAVEMNFNPTIAFTPTAAGSVQAAPGMGFTLAF